MLIDRIILGDELSNEDYHKSEGVSSTFLRSLIENTASKAHWNRLNPTSNSSMDLGNLIHTLVLEPDTFDKRYLILPESHKQKGESIKKNQPYYQEAKELSKTVLSFKENQDLDLLRQNLEHNLDYQLIRHMRTKGKPEVSLMWHEKIYGMDVTLKSRPDWLWEKEGFIFDLKTCQDASDDGFAKSVQNRTYLLQAYMAMRGYEKCFGRKAMQHVWVVIENSKPYDINSFYLDPKDPEYGHELYEVGKDLFYKAMKIYKECKQSGNWPGYGCVPKPLKLSHWYINKVNEMEI